MFSVLTGQLIGAQSVIQKSDGHVQAIPVTHIVPNHL